MQIQELETRDERERLERLITLMPIGERRSRYQTRLARLNATLSSVCDSQLASLRTQHDTVCIEWNRLLDQLETMDQHTLEFDALLAKWETIDDEYKRLCDEITPLELMAHIRQSTAEPVAPQ